MKNKSKFTLIEVLVTLVIFSLIMGIATMAFGHFDREYQRLKKQEVRSFVDLKNYLLLTDTLEAAIDHFTFYETPDGMGFQKMFFEGDEHSVTFVSIRSFFVGEGAALCRLSIEQSDAGEQLVFEETPLMGQPFKSHRNRDQLLKSAKRVVWILEEGISCNLRYYGHDTIFTMKERKKPTWRPSYTAYKSNMLPLSICLEMTDELSKSEYNFNLINGSLWKTGFYFGAQSLQ